MSETTNRVAYLLGDNNQLYKIEITEDQIDTLLKLERYFELAQELELPPQEINISDMITLYKLDFVLEPNKTVCKDLPKFDITKVTNIFMRRELAGKLTIYDRSFDTIIDFKFSDLFTEIDIT